MAQLDDCILYYIPVTQLGSNIHILTSELPSEMGSRVVSFDPTTSCSILYYIPVTQLGSNI